MYIYKIIHIFVDIKGHKSIDPKIPIYDIMGSVNIFPSITKEGSKVCWKRSSLFPNRFVQTLHTNPD